MKNINTIWISTTPRTGSTWIFNVTREIYRILGFTVEPSIVPQKDTEMFKIYHDKAINENNENIKFVLKNGYGIAERRDMRARRRHRAKGARNVSAQRSNPLVSWNGTSFNAFTFSVTLCEALVAPLFQHNGKHFE